MNLVVIFYVNLFIYTKLSTWPSYVNFTPPSLGQLSRWQFDDIFLRKYTLTLHANWGDILHEISMPIFWEKNKKNQIVVCSIFYPICQVFRICLPIVRCVYSLESPRWGDSNEYTQHTIPWRNKNQRTDSPKSLLACKVLMECCVSSMQFYTIHAKKIDDIPMLPILYDKMELYGIYQASGHCTSWIEDFL